jgi:hypothetical protein
LRGGLMNANEQCQQDKKTREFGFHE